MISRLPPFFFSVCRAYVQAINSRSTAISANNANYKQAPQNPKSYKREKKAATYGEKPGLAKYTLEGLRETVPAALCSVSSATIHRHYLYCMRIIDAYGSGATYGTKEFKEQVYKAHWQIADKSKW